VFYNIVSVFLKMFSRIKIYPFPFWLIYNPRGYRMSDEDDKEVFRIIKKGDVLLRGYVDYLDSYFIPGKFTHVGLYIGDREVIHSMQDGVFQEGLMRFLRCDYLAILRPKLTEVEINNVVKEAKNLLGTPYDFILDFKNSDKMCCTEFVMAAFKQYRQELKMYHSYKLLPFTKKLYLYIIPDDFLKYKGFDLLFVNSFAKRKKLLGGP